MRLRLRWLQESANESEEMRLNSPRNIVRNSNRHMLVDTCGTPRPRGLNPPPRNPYAGKSSAPKAAFSRPEQHISNGPSYSSFPAAKPWEPGARPAKSFSDYHNGPAVSPRGPAPPRGGSMIKNKWSDEGRENQAYEAHKRIEDMRARNGTSSRHIGRQMGPSSSKDLSRPRTRVYMPAYWT